ncbi:MAG: hypothetical protein M3T56_11670 [Chloroflexota bacterium]|nr:hypothetical protein [Chloroflexota bacterium]
MDPLQRALLQLFFLFGFVSFSAAIGAEFRGSAGLPKWAMSCVLRGRAATGLGRVGRTLVFFVLAALSPVLVVAGLADSLRFADVASTSASIASLVASVAWLTFLVRWLRRAH